RLQYADWLEEDGDGARAEFIRAQCEWERLPAGDGRRADLEDRADDLLAEHEAAWLGPAPRGLFQGTVRRGLVDHAVAVDDPSLSGFDGLFARHPVKVLELRNIPVGSPELARCPGLPEVHGLFLNGIPDERALPRLLLHPGLSRLTSLRLCSDRCPNLLRTLVTRPGAANLRELTGCRFTASEARALPTEPALAQVRAVGLDELSSRDLDAVLVALARQPERWTELELDRLPTGPRGLDALARLTALRRIECWWPT